MQCTSKPTISQKNEHGQNKRMSMTTQFEYCKKNMIGGTKLNIDKKQHENARVFKWKCASTNSNEQIQQSNHLKFHNQTISNVGIRIKKKHHLETPQT